MAQHLNNQMHQMTNLNMLQGFNFTILNNQQAHLGQAFAQPGQGMYQIVQQVQPGQHQVQLQNVQHLNNQFNSNQFHHLQPQQFNQQQNILQLQQQQNQQLTQQIQQQTTQQIQQQPQQNQIQHQAVQQQTQIQSNKSTGKSKGKGKNSNNNNEQELTKSGKKKRPKANKDGVPAPKRATTAYINFTQYYREQIKKSGRSVPKIGEFGKECAGKWNSMTDEEKKPFTDEAEKDRARYRKEMEVFKPQRDTLKPKRPGTAFMLFMVDFRKEVAGHEPEGGVAALAKLGGERWRGMTDEDKKPYVEQQNECKQAYELKMEEYRKLTGQQAGKPSINNSSKTNSVSVKSEDSNASEQLNNSLSNSNISNNVDQLNNHDESHHNSQSPGSTSPQTANNIAQQTMSPDPQSSLPSIAATISLQSQPFYTSNNHSFMSPAFLDQQHEDVSYSQTIDQQIHDGQNQEHSDQQAYLQNGQQVYQHYGWN